MSSAARTGAERDGTVLAGPAADLRSFGETLRVLVRYAPFILVLAGLAGAGTAVLAKSSESDVAAKSRVVLTNRVVWPYYDAARDRQVEIVGEQETFDEVAERIADTGTLKKLATSVPTGQAFIDIEATASSSDAAIAAANAAADYLVERSKRDVFGSLEQRREQALGDLAAIDKNIADLTAQLTALEPRIVALQLAVAVQNPSASNLTELRQLENQRTSLLEYRAVETSRRGSAIFAADSAATELRNTQGQLEVLRKAFRGNTDPGRTKGVIILAVVVSLFLASLAAIGYDASYQRIRSRRHARSGAARGLPIVAAEELDSDTDYVNRVLEMRRPHDVLGVASAFGGRAVSGRAVSAIAGVIARSGGSVVTFGEGAMIGAGATRLSLAELLVPRDGVARTVAQVKEALLRSSQVHLEVDEYLKGGADTIERLRSVTAELAELADLVILDCGIASDASSRWCTFVGAADLLLLVAERGRTRQSELRAAIAYAHDRMISRIGVSIGVPHVVVSRERIPVA